MAEVVKVLPDRLPKSNLTIQELKKRGFKSDLRAMRRVPDSKPILAGMMNLEVTKSFPFLICFTHLLGDFDGALLHCYQSLIEAFPAYRMTKGRDFEWIGTGEKVDYLNSILIDPTAGCTNEVFGIAPQLLGALFEIRTVRNIHIHRRGFVEQSAIDDVDAYYEKLNQGLGNKLSPIYRDKLKRNGYLPIDERSLHSAMQVTVQVITVLTNQLCDKFYGRNQVEESRAATLKFMFEIRGKLNMAVKLLHFTLKKRLGRRRKRLMQRKRWSIAT